MYGNPLSEFLMFLVDFIVFTVRSIYYLSETFILTILPNRYRKLKVSAEIDNCVTTTTTRHTFRIECELNPWIYESHQWDTHNNNNNNNNNVEK